MRNRRRIFGVAAVCLIAAGLIGGALIAPASAAKAEPTVNTIAWYWVDAQEKEQEVPNVGTVTIETPNPYCPKLPGELGSPAGQTCSPGRLPIEVHNGDYDNQNKISAVNFDLSLIPVGSDVSKFTVTFREAKSGCYDTGKPDQDPQNDACEETDPVNVEGHELQACLVTQFFGDGEARPYNEQPKFDCSGAPTAERKEMKVKGAGPGSDFYWTFDLTDYATNWLKTFNTLAGIMIVGQPAKDENQSNNSWRVVLAGPKFQDGIITNLDYTPLETVPTTPPTGGGGSTGGTGGSGTFGTGTGGGTTFGTDTGTGTGTDTGTGTGGGTAPAPTPSQSPVGAIEDVPKVQEFPAYMWLAILAGLVGFSLVRSVVIEQTTGIRPNGVLATIHRMNAERKGGVAAAEGAAGTGTFAAMAGGVKNVFQKLKLRKKG
ncbi:MAG TPA: hypothetical protein VFK89_10225 [Actinomycetota bacterium]|nr:hypothetical protein [Actinomycetota bacterium]